MNGVVPDGMVEVWTVERPREDGTILIDDLKTTEIEAREEVKTRGGDPWTTERIVVPYTDELA